MKSMVVNHSKGFERAVSYTAPKPAMPFSIIKDTLCDCDKLLLACSRAQLNAETSRYLVGLLHRKPDWQQFLNLAHRNGIMPLVCRHLLGQPATLLPEAVRAQLNTRFAAQMRHNMFLTRELITIIRLLEDAGVEVLPFKGPTLAAHTYGDLSLREFGDLDILVRKKNLMQAAQLLVTHGYKLYGTLRWWERLPFPTNKNKDFVLCSDDGRVMVELHWQLSEALFNFPLHDKKIWDSLQTNRLGGVKVRALPPHLMLLYLCVHGCRHGWIQLKSVVDIAEQINRHPDTDWDDVLRQAEELGCKRVLGLGVLLATDLLDATVPPEVLQNLRSDEIVTSLAHKVAGIFFADKGDLYEVIDKYSYRLLVKERQRDKARLRFYHWYRYLQSVIALPVKFRRKYFT